MTITDLDALGPPSDSSSAYDVNAFGAVVGSRSGDFVFLRPFLWTANGGMVTLGVPVPVAGGYNVAVDARSDAAPEAEVHTAINFMVNRAP